MSAPVPSLLAGEAPRDELLRELLADLTGYLPGFDPRDGSSALALLQLFAHDLGLLRAARDAAIARGAASFLDTHGAALLPAQSARVPVQLALLPTSPVDVDVAARTEVAAIADDGTEVTFATTSPVTVARAQLVAVHCVDPVADTFADYSDDVTSGFTLFGDLVRAEHAIYLGHDRYFAFHGGAQVVLSFGALPADRGALALDIAWEYLTDGGWRAFDDPSLQRLMSDGQIVLQLAAGPAAVRATIGGHESYWIRGRLRDPLVAGTGQGRLEPPALHDVRVRVAFEKTGLSPEAALADRLPLDTSNDFRPFGTTPVRWTTFHVASREVFSRQGARVRMDVVLRGPGGPDGAAPPADGALAWEYWNGRAWSALSVDDETRAFTQQAATAGAQSLSFTCPADWSDTSVGGQSNLWLRARVEVDGLYGSPPQFQIQSDNTVRQTGGFRPPVLASLTLAYRYATASELPDVLVTVNDFRALDQSLALRAPRPRIAPFTPMADETPAVYFGFDRALPDGLVSLFFARATPSEAAEPVATAASPFTWEYLGDGGWTELGVDDQTFGFQETGVIQFVAPWNAIASAGPGGALVRVRARLKPGESPRPTDLRGVWMNTVWARNERYYERDVLGASDGGDRVTVRVSATRAPVLEGEIVEVREWTGAGPGWRLAVDGVAEEELRYDTTASGEIVGVWVRWREADLYGSGPRDRHYEVERSTGTFRFGDGRRGMVPPAAAPIAVTYTGGGGTSGNIDAASIRQLRAAVPYLQSATNPIAASGGAPTEQLADACARAAAGFQHGGRAVLPRDFEWLAREASPAVARARCLPLTGPDGAVERGWVTLVVVAHGDARAPLPDYETLRRVRDHVAANAPATIARRIRAIPPTYVPLSVVAAIVPRVAGDAALVEKRVRTALDAYLHPTHGGADGRGFQLGEPVHVARIAALIEGTEGVDHALRVALRVDGRIAGDVVRVDERSLVCAGDHELRVMLGGAC